MEPAPLTLNSLTDLQKFVRQVLCSRDRLDINQAELRQAWVTRHGSKCGLLFQITGPRLLRTYAIWPARENRVLFYESKGERFAEFKLAASPSLPEFGAEK